ncbi:AbiV family abortive infection protein [Pedobacter sp.]|uniref:AbiV family abortive infection protein n=1 Tax=Pedobacter sp. TaxID=1411316 RepID=UPI003BAC0EB5
MNDVELEKGFRAVMENGRALLIEAKFLLKNNFFARAYSLAQLSIEESGKGMLLYRAVLGYYQGDEINEKYLDSLGFRNHQEKTKLSLKSEAFAIMLFEKDSEKETHLTDAILKDLESISEINNLKNNSLYVGVKNDSFFSPVNKITDMMANEIIEKAEIRLACVEPMFRPLGQIKASSNKLKNLLSNNEERDAFEKKIFGE